MKRKHALIVIAAVASVTMATAFGLHLHSRPPVDTRYLHWEQGTDDRYELQVSHVGGNPDFRRGVTTTPVPQSGTLRVVGKPGTADPGATVEVSNPRTRRGYAVTADAGGAFSVDAEVRRGDILMVISRRIRFRPLEPPRAHAVRD